jgi:hypothetical protein
MITVYYLASTNDGPPAEIMESPTKLSHQCESDTLYIFIINEGKQLKKTRIKKRDTTKPVFIFLTYQLFLVPEAPTDYYLMIFMIFSGK